MVGVVTLIMVTVHLYTVIMDSWQSMVYCTGFENRRCLKASVGSNPTLSAKSNTG